MSVISVSAAVRAACRLYRDLGGRKLAFGPTGIELTDASGTRRLLTVAGQQAVLDHAEVMQALDRQRVDFGAMGDEHEIAGETFLHSDINGVITLRTKKTRMPALETVAAFDAPLLAQLRKAYRHAGVDLFVVCEGETRARELALVIANERALCGLASSTTVPSADRRHWRSTNETATDDPVFDPLELRGPTWNVELLTERGHHVFTAGLDPEQSNVRVSTKSYSYFGQHAFQEAADKMARPSAIVCIEFVRSKPVARVVLSRSLVELVAGDPNFEDAPWTEVVRRRELAASRERPEKTWHPTTEQVAEAYLDRKAPRGYVSGRSLYFHGPIAYSGSDHNAIAAFVEIEGKGPMILMGRGPYGDGDGVTSMAQGDITKALNGRYAVLTVDDLADVLTLGGMSLATAASRMRSGKGETSLPASCVLDAGTTRAWLQRRIEVAELEVIAAAKVAYATNRKVNSFGSLLHVENLRQVLNDAFNLGLPSMLDVADIKAKHEAAKAALFDRQDGINQRRELTKVAGR